MGLENSLLSVDGIELSNVSFWLKSRRVYSSECFGSCICIAARRVEVGRTQHGKQKGRYSCYSVCMQQHGSDSGIQFANSTEHSTSNGVNRGT